MRSFIRVAALGALLALTISQSPAATTYRSYKLTYGAPSTPIVSFMIAGSTENPGTLNPSDKVTALDKTQADQRPLKGTALDRAALRNLGGVTFTKYKGKPARIRVVDVSGLPVLWSACQRFGELPVCGSNPEDVSVVHCTEGDGPLGARVSGFLRGRDVSVWIIANDSAATTGEACDGVATTGTVTLLTTK